MNMAVIRLRYLATRPQQLAMAAPTRPPPAPAPPSSAPLPALPSVPLAALLLVP
jgi:hypothetical protein